MEDFSFKIILKIDYASDCKKWRLAYKIDTFNILKGFIRIILDETKNKYSSLLDEAVNNDKEFISKLLLGHREEYEVTINSNMSAGEVMDIIDILFKSIIDQRKTTIITGH